MISSEIWRLNYLTLSTFCYISFGAFCQVKRLQSLAKQMSDIKSQLNTCNSFLNGCQVTQKPKFLTNTELPYLQGKIKKTAAGTREGMNKPH